MGLADPRGYLQKNWLKSLAVKAPFILNTQRRHSNKDLLT